MNEKTHPLLGVDLTEWDVLSFPTTVELTRKRDRVVVFFPKPYKEQPPEWWKEQAHAAIAKARGLEGGAK